MSKRLIFLAVLLQIPVSALGQVVSDSGVVFHLSQNAYVTWFDIVLVVLCPVFGAIGGFVARHLRLTELLGQVRPMVTYRTTRDDGLDASPAKAYISYPHVGPNATLVGGVLGLVVALYFVGAITDDVTSLARVYALSILLGYQAPNLWRIQAQVVSNLVDERLRAILGDNQSLKKGGLGNEQDPPMK